MITQKLSCIQCGELILPSTAEKTDGLCMPCKTGYRKEIERKKFLHDAEMKHLNTPLGKYWQSLATKIYDDQDNFCSLSVTDKTVFAVGVLKVNVCNGGFNQYFTRDAADYWISAVLGFMEIGATESLHLVMRAKEIYFGEAPLPHGEEARKAILSRLDLSGDQSCELKILDEDFFKLTDKLHALTKKFALSKGLI